MRPKPLDRPDAVGQDVPTSAHNHLEHLEGSDAMAEVKGGLEGVVAFETQIAEPDKAGSALRYRGVDIEELAGRVPFEKVWGLLVDGAYEPGLPPAEPYPIPVHSGDIRADVQSAIAIWLRPGGCGSSTTSTTRRPANTSVAARSWCCPTSGRRPEASGVRWCRSRRSTRP